MGKIRNLVLMIYTLSGQLSAISYQLSAFSLPIMDHSFFKAQIITL
jgi:hypothetical protein